jgi:CO dehydrogenase maturation factor
VQKLASEIGIKRVAAVGCKVRSEDDAEFLKRELALPFLGYLPFRQEIIEADLHGRPAYETAPDLMVIAESLATSIERIVNKESA